MTVREWSLRAARAASFAAVLGVALCSFFYAMGNLGVDMRPGGLDTRSIRLEELPKPEEFSWLVGSLAFVALLLTPLPSVLRTPAAVVRAAAGALAVTLPVAAWDDVWGNGAPWFAWAAVGVPAFAGLLLAAVPLRTSGEAPPASPPDDAAGVDQA